jgi:riboflavin biosynthesis pyrimidine reductase
MPKPHVIVHMTSSVDGRIKIKRWSPRPLEGSADTAYESVHDKLGGDAWICGRVTMAGYAEGEPPPPFFGAPIPREAYLAKPEARRFAIGLDAHARMHWGTRNEITGDHVVMVLTERASDAHLEALRRAGVSYIFGGRDAIDLHRVVETLATTFGIKRLLVEGGGRINGSFLKAGLVDELSLLMAPAVDGLMGGPSVFDYEGGADDATSKDLRLTLRASEVMDGGIVWLRYGVEKV